MRTDAAAVGRIARHDVVEPGVGQEAERVQQPLGRRHEVIQALDEQRPAARGHRPQACGAERTVLEPPATAVADHEPRFAVGARRETKEITHRHGIAQPGPGAADQQRPPLPVPIEKLARRMPPEQRATRGRARSRGGRADAGHELYERKSRAMRNA